MEKLPVFGQPCQLRSTRLPLIVLLLALCLAGCRRSLESSVSGTVTLDGKPLSTGNIVFYPEAGGPIAYGRLDSAGGYRIQTGGCKGMLAGDYRVTVSAVEVLAEDPTSGMPGGRDLTPKRYADPATSELRATIGAGHNGVDFSLQP